MKAFQASLYFSICCKMAGFFAGPSVDEFRFCAGVTFFFLRESGEWSGPRIKAAASA